MPENQPPVEKQPSQVPQAPAQPTPVQQTPQAATTQQPAQGAPAAPAQAAPAGAPPQPQKPAAPAAPTPPKKKPILFLTLGIILLLNILYAGFLFIFFRSGTSSLNTLDLFLNFSHIFYGFFAFITFVMTLIGIFRMSMAKKEDPAKRKGLIMAITSGVLLILILGAWAASYISLTQKRNQVAQISARPPVTTEPMDTANLTAPIEVTFDATNFPIQKNFRVIAYEWNFGDGETGTGARISHTYKSKGKEGGIFNVVLKIRKLNTKTFEETEEEYKLPPVTIANVRTVAEFETNKDSGPAPLEIEFDASKSFDPDGEIVAYEWDMDEDGEFDDAKGVKTKYSFGKEGSYKITLRVTDNSGEFATFEKTIEAKPSVLPRAVISVASEDGKFYVGKPYSFTAEKSSSPTGKIVKYDWSFGDGTPKEKTRSASHTFNKVGTFEVILVVTDESGESAEASLKANVILSPQAPKANIETIPAKAKPEEKTLEGVAPFEVTFDGSKSTDPDNNIVDYKWDFNSDGTVDASGVIAKQTYTDAGTYTATLTVIDADGNETPATLTVKVKLQGITAKITATPVTGIVPLTVSFDASGSTYPGKQIVSYEWDFGDGSAKKLAGAQIGYKYQQVGIFEAKVTAIGADNARNTTKVLVTVQSTPLKACVEPSRTEGATPLTVIFTSCSTGTIAKFNWDIDNDGQFDDAVGPQVTYTFDEKGAHPVSLEITDNQGIVDKTTVTVTGT